MTTFDDNDILWWQAGFKNVVHLKGGFSQWRYDKYPVESSY